MLKNSKHDIIKKMFQKTKNWLIKMYLKIKDLQHILI